MTGDNSSLLSTVRTGASAYHEIFGLPFWEDLEAHPEVAESFDALMGPLGHGTPDPEVLLAGGWEEIKTAVDVGGGTGALLAEILGGVTPEERAECELLMMILLGSKNRTLTEFRELARQAGLTVQAAGQLPSGRFAVECRPM